MEGILKPIRLAELLGEAHLEEITKVAGQDAGMILLSEPTMRDFGIIMSPRIEEDLSDAELTRREAFSVTACLRDQKGERPMTDEHYLDLPASTGRKLSAIVTAWLFQVHKEAGEGLGKKLESVGLTLLRPSETSSEKPSGSSS